MGNDRLDMNTDGHKGGRIDLPHHHHDGEDDDFLSLIPKSFSFEATSDSLKQIGDSTRLKIFWILCHREECVINIAAIMDMSSPAVAHHLKLLRDSGLVTTRREGKEMYYKAADTPIVHVLHRSIEEIMEIRCPDSLSPDHENT